MQNCTSAPGKPCSRAYPLKYFNLEASASFPSVSQEQITSCKEKLAQTLPDWPTRMKEAHYFLQSSLCSLFPKLNLQHSFFSSLQRFSLHQPLRDSWELWPFKEKASCGSPGSYCCVYVCVLFLLDAPVSHGWRMTLRRSAFLFKPFLIVKMCQNLVDWEIVSCTPCLSAFSL